MVHRVTTAKRSLGAAVLCLFLLAPAFGPATSLAASDKTQEEAQLEKAREEERRLLAELDELERRIAEVEDRLIEVEAKMASTGRRLDQGAKQIETLEKRSASPASTWPGACGPCTGSRTGACFRYCSKPIP